MLEQRGSFLLRWFLARLEPERLISRRAGDGVALAVAAYRMRAVIELDERDHGERALMADDEIGDLAAEARSYIPAGPFGQLGVIGDERRERDLRKYEIRGQGALQAPAELHFVRRHQCLALNPGEQVILARNDFTHNVDFLSMDALQTEFHAEKYPKSAFTDPKYKAMLMDTRVIVPPETLQRAVTELRRLGEYLDAERYALLKRWRQERDAGKGKC